MDSLWEDLMQGTLGALHVMETCRKTSWFPFCTTLPFTARTQYELTLTCLLGTRHFNTHHHLGWEKPRHPPKVGWGMHSRAAADRLVCAPQIRSLLQKNFLKHRLGPPPVRGITPCQDPLHQAAFLPVLVTSGMNPLCTPLWFVPCCQTYHTHHFYGGRNMEICFLCEKTCWKECFENKKNEKTFFFMQFPLFSLVSSVGKIHSTQQSPHFGERQDHRGWATPMSPY